MFSFEYLHKAIFQTKEQNKFSKNFMKNMKKKNYQN